MDAGGLYLDCPYSGRVDGAVAVMVYSHRLRVTVVSVDVWAEPANELVLEGEGMAEGYARVDWVTGWVG